MASTQAVQVPEGFRLHTENTTHLLMSENEAFLNPVQEFNRDLSVACIRVWSEENSRIKEAAWQRSQQRSRKRRQKKSSEFFESYNVPMGDLLTIGLREQANVEENASVAADPVSETAEFCPPKAVILEALSATGLRSIRYAKEIPGVKQVIANDLSPAAVEAIKRNVALNNLQLAEESGAPGVIVVNEGDACTLMYSHREEKKRVDVVDIDPYGTAAPFIDSAVQAVSDGGLLCVTCTDLSVLATTNFPEKCFSNYGGVPVKAEYCHESALRLVMHTLSTSASRYGRYLEPLLCLSIDFYVRLFVRVKSSPMEVKKSLTKNANYYICTSCQAYYEQPLGKMLEQKHEPSGHVNYNFKTQALVVPSRCTECESSLHLAGPMWSGPIQNSDFVGKVLDHVHANESSYGTATRMKGMLTVAKEELATPFYFTPAKVAGFFHCETPSLNDTASALLNAGHAVSRSHAAPGSLKTDASFRQIHDIFRCWVQGHPVRMDKIGERSPARKLLARAPEHTADFTPHPDSVSVASTVKLVRYQENPPGWGPAKKAVGKAELKRKRSTDTLEEPPAKH